MGKVIILTMSNKVRPENIMNLLSTNDKWQISGTKLKVNIEDLGAHWFLELTRSIEALSKKLEPGKNKTVAK
jgi:hypothetical protein